MGWGPPLPRLPDPPGGDEKGGQKPHLQLRPSPGGALPCLARAPRKTPGKKRQNASGPATAGKLWVPPDRRAAPRRPSHRLSAAAVAAVAAAPAPPPPPPPLPQPQPQPQRGPGRRRRHRPALREPPSPAPSPAAARAPPSAEPPRCPAPAGGRRSATCRPPAPSGERRVRGRGRG